MNETISIIHILRDYILANNNSDLLYEFDFSTISSILKAQEIEAIVYYQCKDNDFIKDSLYQSFASSVSSYAKRKKDVSAIESILTDVPHTYTKGIEICELYPVPALRSMGDVDLLIKPEDRITVHQLLTKNGFTSLSTSGVEWTYKSQSGTVIEVHDGLAHKGSEKKAFVDFFTQVWDFVKDGKIDWNFHFIYTVFHLQKHFVAGGVGIRQFMDLAVIAKNIDLNWEWIKDKLEEIGLLAFGINVMSMVREWFSISVLITRNLDADYVENYTNYILGGGVFGVNIDACNNELARLVVDKDISIAHGKLLKLMRTSFPTLNRMLRYSYCSYLRKYPFLLPCAWIHRCFHILGTSKFSILKIKNNDAIVEERIKVLRDWGL